ncbi:MAG: hypothetical protein D6727_08135 [Gammaproteobacteria bacterium]|nr:MAG: hypothetical protein D6727_08135 [Gammaproteobacteria bacterium]
MRSRRIFVLSTALLCLLPGLAGAALDALEEALELPLDQVQLPYSEVGDFTVRPCADCEPLRLAVDHETRYFVADNPEPVSLAELRAAAGELDDGLIFIFHEPGGETVTRIVLGG